MTEEERKEIEIHIINLQRIMESHELDLDDIDDAIHQLEVERKSLLDDMDEIESEIGEYICELNEWENINE